MTKGLRSIKPLARESLHGVEPAPISKKRPKFEYVDPRSLYIEDAYQRAIMGNGVALIRKIYEGFDWTRFKPPVCVRLPESGNVLVCIDGQHTATAAATHPMIETIPVMIVDAADIPKRAAAFVGHNKDRLGLTTVMIYAAELAAGDPTAVVIDRACRAAGASIPRRAISTAAGEKHPIGVTMSIGTIRAIAKRQGEAALIRVLRILVGVGRGPIKSVEIAAVALICSAYPSEIDKRLRDVIAKKTAEEWTVQGHAKSIETGKAIAVAVAGAWCDILGLATPELNVKGNLTDHQRVIRAKGDAQPAKIKPSIAVQPKPAPKPAGLATKTAPAISRAPTPAAVPATAPIVERNGIQVDIEASTVKHRGKVLRLADDEIKMIASLARVAPSMLIYGQLAGQVFGMQGDARLKLSQLVDRLNQALIKARLEIKTIPKMGYSLADLGPVTV